MKTLPKKDTILQVDSVMVYMNSGTENSSSITTILTALWKQLFLTQLLPADKFVFLWSSSTKKETYGV